MARVRTSMADAPRGAAPNSLLWMGAIIVLAAAVRLCFLGRLSLWYDEVIHVEYCRQLPIGVFTGKVELVEPFFAVLLYAWQRIATNDIWLRLHGVLFGLASTVLAYRFGARACGRRAGLYAALLVALCPFLVFYSRDAKEYAMVAFLELALAYLAVEYASGAGRLTHLFLYALAATLAIYSHNVVPFFLLAVNVVYLACYARSIRKTVYWAVAQVSVIVLGIPWFLAQYRFVQAMEHKSFWAPVPTVRSLYVTLANLFAGYVVYDGLRIAACVLVGGLLLAGLLLSGRDRRLFLFLSLVALMQIAALFVFSRFGTTSYYVDRFLVGSGIVLLMACAVSMATLPRAWCRYAVLVISTILMGVSLHDLYANRLSENWLNHVGVYRTYDARAMAACVKGEWRQGDVILHTWKQVLAPMRWYSRDLRHILVDMSKRVADAETFHAAASAENINADPVEIENAVAGANRVWFVVPDDPDSMKVTFKGIRAWLEARGGVPREFKFGGKNEIHAPSTLFLYDLAHTGTDPAAPHAEPSETELSKIHAALSAGTSGSFEVVLSLSNSDRMAQQVYFQLFAADAVCPAPAFERALAQDSRWRVQPFRDHAKARMALHTRVDAKSHPADLVSQSLSLAGGRYEVYMERIMTGPGYPSPTAEFLLRVDDAEFHIPGMVGPLPGGWMWRRVGKYEKSTGGETLVSVLAQDPMRLPEALGTFSMLVFVRNDGEDTAKDTPLFHEGLFTVAAGKTERITVHHEPGVRHVYCAVALPRDSAVIQLEF